MIHGKQIKDVSINLSKINTITGQTLTLLGTSKIQQTALPTNPLDLVNKSYVDAARQGLTVKTPCRVATTANITIATAPATIDGVTLVAGDRILVKNQTTGSQNGLYAFVSTGAPLVRTDDANENPNTGGFEELVAGTFTFIEEGTVNQDSGFVLTTNNPIVIGTTSLVFVQFSGAGSLTADNGLTKTGSNIQLGGALLQNTSITGNFVFDVTMSTGANFGVLQITSALAKIEFLNTTSTSVSRVLSNNAGVRLLATDFATGLISNSLLLSNVVTTIANNGTNNTIVLTDAIASKGAVYAADYSANFTFESLVTKRYVDNAGSVLTSADKSITASVTTASGQQLSAGITATPKNDCYVLVFINGIKTEVGNGVNTKGVYFADAGTLGTPKSISAIVAGDVLVRGTTLGYDTDATDVVEYDYLA